MGMMQLEYKKVTTDLRSQTHTWTSLGVSQEIQKGLAQLSYNTPSIIQSSSILKIS